MSDSSIGDPRPSGRGDPPHTLTTATAWSRTTSPSVVLSMWDAIQFGIDEHGRPVRVRLADRTLLIGGLPGSGKSGLINNIISYAALCHDCELWLFDGKDVELAQWEDLAHTIVGNNITDAINALQRMVWEMQARYAQLKAARPRRSGIDPRDRLNIILAVIDELAYFTVMSRTDEEQDLFIKLVMTLVALGRAVGIIVVAATQRPSADIVPTKLRDIMGFRVAFRCATDSSSNIILGDWSGEGYTARDIDPEAQGVGLALAEEGIPVRFKSCFLTNSDFSDVVACVQTLRDITKRLHLVP
jgi:S-DNA-T family DNA segregation ATPase FtsK/SpoIIIE